MNKNLYITILAISISHIMTVNCGPNRYLQKIKDFFRPSMIEEVEQQEFPAATIESIDITNINGHITIQTGPKKSLFVKATKRARKANNLDTVAITINENKPNHLGIATRYSGPKNKRNSVIVDYELIVPASLNVKLKTTGRGDIVIKNIQGTIEAVAQDNITIAHTQKSVLAQTIKKGSITILHTAGPIEARTYAGTIKGEHIAHSFYADTTKGNINLTYKNLPSTACLDLKSSSGNIILALPTETSAQVRGHTAYGTFMSEHQIQLKSYTTLLNKQAWIRFKKEIEGTLGSGQATIALRSTKGNIKIIETKMT